MKTSNLNATEAITGRNLFVSPEGLAALGRYVNNYRISLPNEMRLEDMREKIIAKTSYKQCSVSTLSKFENGTMRHNPNLVAAIAATLQIPHKAENRYYSAYDLEEAARMNLDLEAGLPYKKKNKKNADY